MINSKEIINEVWNGNRIPFSKQSVVERILNKDAHQRTEEELKTLHEELFKEKDQKFKNRIDEEIKNTYAYMYQNPRFDATGRLISDKVELPKAEILNKSKNQIKDEKIEDLAEFMKKYAEKVGAKQAIQDLQKTLNLINKGRENSLITEKHPLKIDGDFGEKTDACLNEVCKNYPARVVMKKFRKTIFNNIINDKNKKNKDKEEAIRNIAEDLIIKPREDV